MPEELGIFKMIVCLMRSQGVIYFRNPLAMGVNQWKGRVEFFFSFLLMIPSAYLPSTIPDFQVRQKIYYFLKCQKFRKVPSC